MYTSGAHWNVTHVGGITITWVNVGSSRPEQGRVASILDPTSAAPARRVLRDGTAQSLGEDTVGLTVFGTHVADRPTPEQVAELAPAWSAAIGEFRRGGGVTHHRVTSDDPLLGVREAAARIGVQPRTISRYRARGELPHPDEVVSGRPRWRASTIDSWAQTRPGRGRARTTSAR